ncbi:MAG: 3-phosphoshikimate 1-carboxyvinyltransferase [Vicingaceae bacterium]|jgi:3-phosphoshikimate 1-carboxyvinyltransferase
MSTELTYKPSSSVSEIDLPSSKSISNRLLIARSLSKNRVPLTNLSTANDTLELQNALNSSAEIIDVGMAGTAFRFLTAFYAMNDEKRILTGAKRMKERPIEVLVDQLRSLGANIDYQEREGFPPLQIQKGELKGGKRAIDASVSSQYISAVLLIAPYLEDGLELTLQGEIVSSPYIDLTISLQQQLNVNSFRKGNKIIVKPGKYYSQQEITVEADWSSAAFFYQFAAFSCRSIFIKNLNPNSLQGDVECWKIFIDFGVVTEFVNGGALLTFDPMLIASELTLDLTRTPDLIPSVAVTASQLLKKITIVGTKTLYIKECNRVEALKVELLKIGSVLNELDGNSFEILGSKMTGQVREVAFSTYNDHRMAMSLAPLAVYGKVTLDHKKVVEKSFPTFWIALEKAGIFS